VSRPNALKAPQQAWLSERRQDRRDFAEHRKALHYSWDAGMNILLVDYSALLGSDCPHAVSDWTSGFATLRYAEGLFEAACVCEMNCTASRSTPRSAADGPASGACESGSRMSS
jgi:hypothetical protein